jgi:N6-adenosine-specific RNA methylase IME4
MDRLPRNHFGVIAADPGTRFNAYSAKGETARTPQMKYTTLSDDEIAALPVIELAARHCHLFYWDTTARVAAGLHIQIMRAWGFKPTAIAFTWVKLRAREPESAFIYPRTSFNFGPGMTTRKGTELCVLGRRGSPKRLSTSVRELIVSPRREHSRKPDEFYERVQEYAAGPYLELFARQRRPGWIAWGDEADKFDAVA